MTSRLFVRLPRFAASVILRDNNRGMVEEAYEALAGMIINGDVQAFDAARPLFVVSDMIPVLHGTRHTYILHTRLRNEKHKHLGVARLALEAFTTRLKEE